MAAPTLSGVREWTPDYLTSAAAHWEHTAAAWNDAYDHALRGVRALSDTEWVGTASGSAMHRIDADRQRVDAAVGDLRAAASTVRLAASELADGRHDLLAAVSAAEAEAFVVCEDYSVRDLSWILSPGAAMLRRLRATAHATAIKARALALSALDDDASHAIITAGSRLDDLRFASQADAFTQAVDFHGVPFPERPRRPNPTPTPPPGGWSDDPITRAAQHIAYGHANLKHLVTEWPPGTTTEYLAKEVERMMRAAADPQGGMIVGRTGDGAPTIYDPKTNTIVIRDPRAADYGTVFRPRDGIEIVGRKMATRVPAIPLPELAAAPPPRVTPESPKVEPRPAPRVGLPPIFVPPQIIPGPPTQGEFPVIDVDGIP